jgi:hypothetical protein
VQQQHARHGRHSAPVADVRSELRKRNQDFAETVRQGHYAFENLAQLWEGLLYFSIDTTVDLSVLNFKVFEKGGCQKVFVLQKQRPANASLLLRDAFR